MVSFEAQASPLSVVAKSAADAIAFSVFSDASLRRQVRDATKLNSDVLWVSFSRVIEKLGSKPIKRMDPIDVHAKILLGLPGEAMFLSSVLVFDSFKQSEVFFEVTSKTARQRIGSQLHAAESEKALRLVRAFVMARQALGDAESARSYLKTPNFALGGRTPRDLLQTAEGEQIVLNEIQTQAEGGPV